MEKIKRMKTKCANCGKLKNKTIYKIIKDDEYLIRENFCIECGILKNKTEIKLNINTGIYRYLTIDRKSIGMHRFVYELFHNVRLTPYDTIHHIDCIKSHNIPSNLLLTEHHNPTMHKAHQYYKNKYFLNRIKELEDEVEYYKKKANEMSKVRP